MGKPKITLYLDIVSPFAYISFYALKNFPIFKQCEITFVPIYLGGLMHMCNNRPPLAIKNKARYVEVNRLRFARMLKIPMHDEIPPNFPPNTLLTERALAAISLSQPSKLDACIAALYDAFFVHHKNVSTPEVIVEALSPVLGGAEKVKALLEQTAQPEVKKQLTQNTEMAFKDGAFGIPWMVAENSQGVKEGFWGVDHMGLMVEHLGLERSRDEVGWKSLL